MIHNSNVCLQRKGTKNTITHSSLWWLLSRSVTRVVILTLLGVMIGQDFDYDINRKDSEGVSRSGGSTQLWKQPYRPQWMVMAWTTKTTTMRWHTFSSITRRRDKMDGHARDTSCSSCSSSGSLSLFPSSPSSSSSSSRFSWSCLAAAAAKSSRNGGNEGDGGSASPGGSTSINRLPEGYQDMGNEIIWTAGKESFGMINPQEQLTIEWKADRIIVTVQGSAAYVSANEDDDDDDDNLILDEEDDESEDDDDDDDDDDDNLAIENEEEDDDEFLSMVDDTVLTGDMEPEVDEVQVKEGEKKKNNEPLGKDGASGGGIDVASLARAINAALDDGGIGLLIAQLHEIEVTTPGTSDELQGPVMFEAYRGFDVICQQKDRKTNKIKQIEGRLVERNDQYTIINIKGRMKKMENETVLSVKLPKAKKEKGLK